jgi:hypothetical protein
MKEDTNIIYRKRDPPGGYSSVGISALHVYGNIGYSDSSEAVKIRMDAGADLSLISEEFYLKLEERPKLKQGLKLHLIHLTGNAKVIGYVNVPIYLDDNEGV